MKKVLFIIASLVLCTLMLAGCGTETPPATKDVVLYDVLSEINTEFFDDGNNMKLIETSDKLELYYDIAPADVADFAAEVSKNSATEIDEVVLIKAVDEAAAKRVAEKLELRLQAQKDLCASYSPELLAIAEKCSVTTNGLYVSLIVTENYDEVNSLYLSLVVG